MELTRRDWLGLASAAGLAATISEPLLGQTLAPGPHAEAVRRIRAFAAADLAEKGFPGMALAIAAPDGFSTSFGVGHADLERRTPVAPGQLFQIGSITKSLTAMALFVLAGQGKLDLDARVQALLPDYPLPPEPITVTQLLEHSGGLPNSVAAPFLEVPGGRLWTGFAPGSRYSYCNTGYALLGALIERASGMSYPRAMSALVLKPLGMAGATAAIRTADRERYATGYTRLRDDVPWLPKARLAPARWIDFASGAGSVAATGPDMVRYLKFVASLARGKGAPLFSEALAQRFSKATIDAPDAGPGARYGNGLQHRLVDERPCFRHTGGMIAFSSAVTVDRGSGAGCYASVNVGGAGGYRPIEVTEYAVALLRASSEGRPLPPFRTPAVIPPVEAPSRFIGRWVSAEGELIVSEGGGGLRVRSGGLERPLRRAGKLEFTTDHPRLAPYGLVFEGESLAILRIGSRLYGRGAAPAAQPVNPDLARLAGTYFSGAAWYPRVRLDAVGDRLLAGSARLMPAPDGSWRFDDPEAAPERVWFERPVAGVPQRLNFSGTRYDRLDV